MSGRSRPAHGDGNSRRGEMVCENGGGQTIIVVGMVRTPPAPIYTERIPPELATNETWMLDRRKARPRVRPAAFFRPPGYEPEFRGSDLGIPLYTHDQTQPYHATPPTLASQVYYDLFVASQNRQKLSVWFDGRGKKGRRQKPGWRTFDKYLSRAKIRAHLRGRDIYACWGDEFSRWFLLDVDFHDQDPASFLAVLKALEDLPGFFPEVRWFYSCNRQGLRGLHIVGVLPHARRLEDIQADVRKVLAYLEDENLNTLRQFKRPDVPDDAFKPLTGLEIYPAPNHAARLPYARDRITITDEWLNLPGQEDFKANLVRFVEYLRDGRRQPVPFAQV